MAKGRPKKVKAEEIKKAKSEIDKNKILNLVLQKLADIKQSRISWESKIDNWYKHYNNEVVSRYYQGSANVFIGATFEAAEVIKTIFMELLFPRGEVPFDIKPVEASDVELARDVWKPLLAFQMEKRVGLEQKIEQAIETLLVCGTCVVKTPYTYNTKWVKREGKLENLPADDYPDFIPWDLKKVYFNPAAKRVEDLDIVIFESTPTLDQVKRLDKKYNPKGIYEDTDKLSKIEYQKETRVGDTYKSHIPEVQLYEAWLNYDLNDDGIAEEIVCVIANRKVVLRFDPNPYDIQEKPVLICGLFPQKGMLIGKGIPEAIFDMQVQLNDAANQTLDDGSHILNAMWAFDQTRLDRASARIHLKSRPDGIIPIKHGDPKSAVVQLEKPNIMNEGLLMIKLLRDWIRSITGAEYSLQGLPGAYKPTATEYSGQQNVAMARVKRYVKKFERMIVKPFLRKAYEYDMQYMTRKEFLKILGEKGAKYKTVSLSKLRIDCDFLPVGTLEMENKTARIQQLMGFLNILGKFPLPVLMQLMKINLGAIAEECAERFGIPKDKIFFEDPTPELISPEDENQLIMDGHDVEVKIQDNHLRHMPVHATLPESEEKTKHMTGHVEMMRKLEQMTAQMRGGGVPTQEFPKGERMSEGEIGGKAVRPTEQF